MVRISHAEHHVGPQLFRTAVGFPEHTEKINKNKYELILDVATLDRVREKNLDPKKLPYLLSFLQNDIIWKLTDPVDMKRWN